MLLFGDASHGVLDEWSASRAVPVESLVRRPRLRNGLGVCSLTYWPVRVGHRDGLCVRPAATVVVGRVDALVTNSQLVPQGDGGEREVSRLDRLRDTFTSNYSPSGLLILLVISFDLLFVTSSFVLTQYFGEDVATSITFIAEDGHWSAQPSGKCDLATEGVGVHCFGDYTLATRFAERADP